jgi:hypothetical protein
MLSVIMIYIDRIIRVGNHCKGDILMINNVQSTNNATYISNSAKKNQATGSFDSIMQSAMNNKNMNQIFEEAAVKYDVPENLLRAVAQAESDFNPKAVSSCGAVGVMQLMPDTAKSLGVTDPYNAEQNINGGAKYLSSLLKKYDGDIDKTLAAYNAGPGNVAKYGGVPPFKETQNYISKIKSILAAGSTSVQNISVNKSATNSIESLDTASASISDAKVKEYLAYIQLSMLSKLQDSLGSKSIDPEYFL